MSIHALVLYGSCAREDHDKDSDVDIFALSTESTYRMIIHSKMNIACYPEPLAIERAHGGDLFILHIMEEGKIIYDTCAKFQNLKKAFQYKENYVQEITHATDLGWLLVNIAKTLSNYTLLNRRIAWCVRTILIAKSAEKRDPRFSAQDLCNFSGEPYVYTLIKNKNNDKFDEVMIKMFLEFLEIYGTKSILQGQRFELAACVEHFTKTQNIIGLKTIAFLESDSADDAYC